MNVTNSQQDRFFWMEWLFACLISMGIGLILAFFTLWTVAEAVGKATSDIVGILVGGALFGLFIGGGISIGQGIALRRQNINITHWIALSAVSSLIGSAVSWTAVFQLVNMDNFPEIITGLLMGFILGLSLGIGQWLVLRKHNDNAVLWILFTTAAFAISFMIGFPLGGEGREFISFSVTVFLVVVLTGVGMHWLLRRKLTAAF